MDDCELLVGLPGRAIVAERLVASLDRTDPTRVKFRREELKPYRMASRAILDSDGDGRPDLELPAGGETEVRYREQGVYCAAALLQGADGTAGLSRTWVEAVGYRERKGVHLLVTFPRPDGVVETADVFRTGPDGALVRADGFPPHAERYARAGIDLAEPLPTGA